MFVVRVARQAQPYPTYPPFGDLLDLRDARLPGQDRLQVQRGLPALEAGDVRLFRRPETVQRDADAREVEMGPVEQEHRRGAGRVAEEWRDESPAAIASAIREKAAICDSANSWFVVSSMFAKCVVIPARVSARCSRSRAMNAGTSRSRTPWRCVPVSTFTCTPTLAPRRDAIASSRSSVSGL